MMSTMTHAAELQNELGHFQACLEAAHTIALLPNGCEEQKNFIRWQSGRPLEPYVVEYCEFDPVLNGRVGLIAC